MFNAIYFISLFGEFEKNELEINTIINGMTAEDIQELDTQDNKEMAKNYGLYWTKDNGFHIYKEDEHMNKNDKFLGYEAESFMVPMNDCVDF